MCRSIVLTISLNLLLVCAVSVYAVKISPKLDFGESNTQPLSAGVRPHSETKYLRNNGGTRSHYKIDPSQLGSVEVICISGNCNTIKSTTENTNGISADVLVHIKTNVDVSRKNNDTAEQPVPDVPIVVGTKATTITANNQFIPPSRPGFIQNPQLQTDVRSRDFFGATNYAPRFQGADNDIGLQSTYVGYPLYGNNNNANNDRPIGARPTDFSKGVRGNYNPVEFRKTYNNNNWSPVKWARRDPSNAGRRTESGIRRWTPCVCQSPELHLYPTTSPYSQPNQPAGINGKLTPLV